MKNLLLFITFCLLTNLCQAQYFQATFTTEGNDLIFKIRPSGGNITTDWSDIEFFIRWPDGSPAFTFGNVTMNTAQFPGVPVITGQNLPNNNGQEIGYANAWFGGSFTATQQEVTYTNNTEYEVFRVTLNVPASTINFELVHNENFVPTYLALTGGLNGAPDRTAPNGVNKFYGTTATICNNCPATTASNNHVDQGNTSVLPVELIAFHARPLNNEHVLLEWQTESERNSEYFSIERSISGERFESIGEVNAAGHSDDYQAYQMIDKSPERGTNYYRLKQFDFDGSFEYSEIRVVNFDKGIIDFTVYPNPASEILNIAFSSEIKQELIQLFDVKGQLIEAFHLDQDEFHHSLNIQHLPKGSYWLYFENNGQKYNRKIILQ